jgi:hypothetical protein
MSYDFENILERIDSPICVALLNLHNEPSDFSLIMVGDDVDTISFTTSTKLSQHFNTYDYSKLSTLVRPLRNETLIYFKNNTNIRAGRFIKKIFLDEFTDQEIENFVNQYKSIREENSLNFEIWEGNKIISGYQSKNYNYDGPSSNPLMNSCMNDELHLIDFYQYVPVKLLVLLNSDGHIFGRSLIWQTDKGLFMDRIYVTNNSDYFKFINYAKTNNIIYKNENKSGPSVEYVKDGKVSWFPMIIKLKFNIDEYSKEEFSGKIRDIPYMDTFIYGQKSRLSNYEPLDNKYYVLTDTDGEPLEVIPQYTVDGQRIEADDLDNYEWSNTQNGWVYKRRGYYVASEKDFFSLDFLKDPKNGFILSVDKWIKNEK